jgi:HK97 family phage major capsid protein
MDLATEIKNQLAQYGGNVKVLGDRLGAMERQLQLESGHRETLERKMNEFKVSGLPTPLSGDRALTADERKAVDKAIRSLFVGDQAAADRSLAEVKAMSGGVDAAGGYTVIPEFSSSTTRVMLEVAPFIALPRTITLDATDTFEEIVDRDEAGTTWVGESESRPDTDTPEVGKLSIPVREIYAQPKATQKLIDTSQFDVIGWLRDKVGEKFGYSEVDAFLNGNGVTRPRGILTYPTAATGDATRAWGTLEHVPTNASGDFAGSNPFDVLVDTVSKLKSQYRQGAVWLMNRFTIAKVSKFKGVDNQYLWRESTQVGDPARLLGYPVIPCEQMPDPAAGSLSIAFGNIKRGYTIVRRLGQRFLVDPFTDKPNVRVYVYERVGGGVANFEAIKLVKFSE